MYSRYFFYIRTISYLILKDLYLFKRDFYEKMVNACILLFTNIVVFSYFLPAYGLKNDYSPFVLIGIITSFSFLESIGKVGQIIADLEGDRVILYLFALPIPYYLIFIYLIFSWSIQSFFMCILLFFLGKLISFSEINLENISYLKFFLIFIMSNLFFASFALWLSSTIKKVSSLSNLNIRFINPMYMFGGIFYSWYMLHETSKLFSYFVLLNPLIYAMEGIRSTILTRTEFLPFWLNFTTLFLFTLFFGYRSIVNLSKKIDCV